MQDVDDGEEGESDETMSWLFCDMLTKNNKNTSAKTNNKKEREEGKVRKVTWKQQTRQHTNNNRESINGKVDYEKKVFGRNDHRKQNKRREKSEKKMTRSCRLAF